MAFGFTDTVNKRAKNGGLVQIIANYLVCPGPLLHSGMFYSVVWL
jgi:hypothetical protein